MTTQFNHVNNSKLSKLVKAVEKANSASATKTAQKALDAYTESAFLVLRFQNEIVKVFNAEKNARKFLRDHGYRTCLLEKEKSEKTNQRQWTHKLAYTGNHDKITNDVNEYAIREYEKQAMTEYLAQKEKAQKEKEKAQKETA